MTNPNPKPIPPEAARRGGIRGRLAQAARVRLEKKKLKAEQANQQANRLSKIMKDLTTAGSVFVATPAGQIITGFFLVNMLEQNELLVKTDAVALKEFLLGAELVSALGASGLITEIGSLTAALGAG